MFRPVATALQLLPASLAAVRPLDLRKGVGPQPLRAAKEATSYERGMSAVSHSVACTLLIARSHNGRATEARVTMAAGIYRRHVDALPSIQLTDFVLEPALWRCNVPEFTRRLPASFTGQYGHGTHWTLAGEGPLSGRSTTPYTAQDGATASAASSTIICAPRPSSRCGGKHAVRDSLLCLSAGVFKRALPLRALYRLVFRQCHRATSLGGRYGDSPRPWPTPIHPDATCFEPMA